MPTDSPGGKRRLWPRYTLRVLLAAMTVTCVLLALATNRALRQRRLVQRIEAGQGQVHYDDWDDDSINNTCKKWVSQTVGPDFVYDVWDVELSDSTVLPDLARLPKLEFLTIWSADLTDERMQHVSKLKSVRWLNLRCNLFASHSNLPTQSQLGDSSLHAIGRMPAVECVSIDGMHFSGAGLAALSHARTLKEVEVSWCLGHVTEQDVEVFKVSGIVQKLEILRWSPERGSEVVAKW